MKFLSILLGVLFVFSVSQKAFACDCDKAHKGDKAPASTTVADAKDSQKAEGCACEKSGKDCKCKDCGCDKNKESKKEAHKHKKGGKDCGCDDKHEA